MTNAALIESKDSSPATGVGTSVELFTGGGGLARAMQESGFRHLLAVELDRRACETLRANGALDYREGDRAPVSAGVSWPLVEGDIHKVEFDGWRESSGADAVDVVAGGVPCQPWSLGGAHKGFEDPRNLWPELFRTVRETRPRAVIAENVKGLLRPSFKPYYDYILRELAAPFEDRVEGEEWSDHDKRLTKVLRRGPSDPTERYDVKYLMVNAADYGVPQTRWRVFVVAFRADLGLTDWEFPAPTHSDAALLRDQAEGTYWERHGIEPGLRLEVSKPLVEDGLLPWRTLRDGLYGNPDEPALRRLPYPSRPLEDKTEDPRFLYHRGWPGARIYKGHTPNLLDRPAKTVKAGVHGVPGGETVMEDPEPGHEGEHRYMTVREVARVMTFPDEWRLAGPRGEQMRQLGNAVPVKLGKVMADSVRDALRSVDTR